MVHRAVGIGTSLITGTASTSTTSFVVYAQQAQLSGQA